MILIDDFLTRTWHDPTPDDHGLGRNIPADYVTMTVDEEWAALQAVQAMGIPFMVFMIGMVLDSPDPRIQAAIKWLIEQKIPICGHGYTHCKEEYLAGYNPAAARTLAALKRVGQPPPYYWRFPRHEAINADYIVGLGFEMVPYDYYLDPELNARQTLDVLRGHDHHTAWVHSVYLTRVFHGRKP